MHDPTNSEDSSRPPTNEEFAQLLAANQDVLLWFIKSLLPGSPDVDDILQNTNLVLWRKQETFRMGKSLNECAEAFELSAMSMKSTLHRIRTALRRCIESRLALNQASK